MSKLDTRFVDNNILRGFKNRIINGDFAVWQRGTTATNVNTSRYHTADRWLAGLNTGSVDFARGTLNGFNSLRATINTVPDLTVNTNYFTILQYRFEGSHLYDLAITGKTITISFLFRSNVTGNFAVSLRHYKTGVNVDSYVATFAYNTVGSVQKVELTIPLNHTWSDPPVNNNNFGFVLDIASLAGANFITATTDTWQVGNFVSTNSVVNWASAAGNYVEIAQVQLEEGDIATEFEFVPYDIQLLRCMRYYEIGNYSGGTSYAPLTNYTWFGAYSTGFRVIKRSPPTISFSTFVTNSNIGSLDISVEGFYAFVLNTAAGNYFYWGGWIADAEL